jgi:hypothetical protein
MHSYHSCTGHKTPTNNLCVLTFYLQSNGGSRAVVQVGIARTNKAEPEKSTSRADNTY